MCLCIVIFSFEIIIYLLTNDNYFLSFFFWLDVLTNITLILDLTFVENALFERSETNNIGLIVIRNVQKIFRLFRLVRVIKMIKVIN